MSENNRKTYRRKEDKLFMPSEEQERQVAHLMEMPAIERERFQFLMHLDTREKLFTHVDNEEKKIESLHESWVGNEEKGIPSMHKAVQSFIETEKRLNTWLNGACFVLKTVIPWLLALIASALGILKYLGVI